MSYCCKTIGIVRYLTYHLTAVCSTSRFYNYAFATFLCCIVSAGQVPLEWNRAPKPFFLPSYFRKKIQLQVSPFYLPVYGSDILQRLVYSTRAFRHLHLLSVHCFAFGRHAHCCIPCPPNSDCSQNTSLSPTMPSVPTALTLPAFVSPRAELVCWIEARSALSCLSGYGM